MKNRKSSQESHGQQAGFRICGRCKSSLPLEEFYLIGTDGHADCYCKSCRRTISREQRKNDLYAQFVDKKPSYPVITALTDDREMRLVLINKALGQVRKSIEQKREKEKEKEFNAFR